MAPRPFILILPILGAAGLAACSEAPGNASIPTIAGGDPEQGRRLIHAYGCGTCHVIEGIRGARGKVGPTLADYAQPHLLAGFLPNTPPYLIAWLMDPVALSPQTGMPALGLTEEEARHIASYLYSLGEPTQIYPPDLSLPLGKQDVVTGLDDPLTPPSDTTPRTHRIAPQRRDRGTPRD